MSQQNVGLQRFKAERVRDPREHMGWRRLIVIGCWRSLENNVPCYPVKSLLNI